MIDFLIELCVDVGELFVEIWVNKIAGRFRKKKEKNPEKTE